MKCQYFAEGRMAGKEMYPTCPGHAFPFLSFKSACDQPLYKKREKKVGKAYRLL